MASTSIEVSPAQFPRDTQLVAALFLAYAQSLNIDLAFQSFEQELAQLPGKYASENGGALLLAHHRLPTSGDGTAGKVSQPSTSASPSSLLGDCIGCIALRRHGSSDVCELKRLYIVPEARGLGAGGALIAKALEMAREAGYREVLLDTLSTMVAARKLYVRYGFEETAKYYENPLPDVIYYKATLV